MQLKQPPDDAGKDSRKAGDTGGNAMTDDPERVQEVVGQATMAFWRDTLRGAADDTGEQIAATSMLMVAVEALRSGMGNESAARMLEALAGGVRSGEDVTVSIDPDRETEH